MMILYCVKCEDTATPIVADVIWLGTTLCWSCMKEEQKLQTEASSIDWNTVLESIRSGDE